MYDRNELGRSTIALFIEPAPYIIRLNEELCRQWEGDISSWYVASSVSQNWQGSHSRRILPSSKVAAMRALWSEMRQIKPSIVLVAGWGHPLIIWMILMGRAAGAKVVSLSDTWENESTGLRHFTKLCILRLINRFCPGGQRQARFLQDLGVPSCKLFPANMSVDTITMRSYFDSEGATQRREIRDELGLSEKEPLCLYVGRLEPVKGLDILLEAFQALPRDARLRLVIVGDGSMRNCVERAASFDARIVGRGRLEGAELWAQYAAADVLVAPSRKESWGLVVNEALTAGLPVVLTDKFGCIDDLVRQKENGLIIPSEDPKALSDAMMSFIQDPDFLDRLRKTTSLATVVWSSQAWATNIIGAWQDALQGSSPGSLH